MTVCRNPHYLQSLPGDGKGWKPYTSVEQLKLLSWKMKNVPSHNIIIVCLRFPTRIYLETVIFNIVFGIIPPALSKFLSYLLSKIKKKKTTTS